MLVCICPPQRKQSASPTSCTAQSEHIDYIAHGSRIKALVWLTCLNNERHSRRSFPRGSPFMQEWAGDKHDTRWSCSGTQTFDVIQYQPRGKRSVETFANVSNSHITWLSYHQLSLNLTGGELQNRQPRSGILSALDLIRAKWFVCILIAWVQNP